MNQFQYEALKINEDIRCLEPGNVFCFGVPAGKSDGLKKIPEKVNGFKFYLGSDCENLFEAFAKSEYTSNIEILSIGDSSFEFGNGRDYQKVISLLESASFPNLKYLSLGVWELFHNSHGAFGKIGNLTNLLLKMPNLEELSISGAFQLDSRVNLRKLRELNVELDDCTTGINGGYISQQTLDYLLKSPYPNLRKAFIDLSCENDEKMYDISSTFLSGVYIPELSRVEFAGGFASNVEAKVKASVLSEKLENNFIFENFAQES